MTVRIADNHWRPLFTFGDRLAKSAPRLGVRTYPWREAGRPARCTRRPAHGAHGLLIQPVQNVSLGRGRGGKAALAQRLKARRQQPARRAFPHPVKPADGL